jgi:hypothetical protein
MRAFISTEHGTRIGQKSLRARNARLAADHRRRRLQFKSTGHSLRKHASSERLPWDRADAHNLRSRASGRTDGRFHSGSMISSPGAPVARTRSATMSRRSGAFVSFQEPLLNGGSSSAVTRLLGGDYALGADFVLAGRPFLFSTAALGRWRGPEAVLKIFRSEIEAALAQIGCGRVEELSHRVVRH